MNKLPPIQGLWIGHKLGPIQQISIRSFMGYGHPYHLYTYDKVENIPEGVEVKDGNQILPSKFLYKGLTRGYAPFSDWFRWSLMQKKGGIYMDLDMIALRALDLKQPVIMCYESPERICGAVLKIPSEHPLVTAIVDRCNKPKGFFLKYLIFDGIVKRIKLLQYNPNKSLLFRIKSLFVILYSTGSHLLLACVPGSKYNSREYQRSYTDGELAGPTALTFTTRYNAFGKLKKSEIKDLRRAVLPSEKFFPVTCLQFEKFLKAGYREKDLKNMFPDSYAVHIWSDMLKWHNKSLIAPDSYLGLMAKKYGVDISEGV